MLKLVARNFAIVIVALVVGMGNFNTVHAEESQFFPDQHIGLVNTSLRILEKNFYDNDKLDKIKLYNSLLRGANEALGREGVENPYRLVPSNADENAANTHFQRELARTLKVASGHNLDQKQIAFAAVEKMLRDVGDSHTRFIDPQTNEEWQARLQGNATTAKGYGFMMASSGGIFYLDDVFPDSTLDKAGAKPFDHLLSVNNRTVSSFDNPSRFMDFLHDIPESEEAEFKLFRNNEVIVAKAQKGIVILPSSKVYIIEQDGLRIGVVKLYQFSRMLLNDLIMLPMQLDPKNIDGIIVDVRDNGGGFVYVLNFLLEQFLPKGEIAFYTQSSSGKEEVKMQNDATFDCPLIVLTDGYSFSASEIFASAVKESKRGIVIGGLTGGSVSVGQKFSLPFGSAMMVTVEQVISRNGRDLERIGVLPNILQRQRHEDIVKNQDTLIVRAIEEIKQSGDR